MSGRGFKVLLVDDDVNFFNLIRYILVSTHKPYKLDFKDGFVKGLDAVKQDKHDVYLIDETLSPGKGLRLIEKAKTFGIKKPFILLSETLTKKKIESAIDVGAVEVLEKNKLTAEVLDKTILLAVTSQELDASKKRLNLYFSKIANLSLLTRLGKILASKLNFDESAKETAKLLVKEMADWCLFVVAERGENNTTAEHILPEKQKVISNWVKEFPPDTKFNKWPYSIMKSGQPMLYKDIDNLFIKKVATNTKEAGILRGLGFSSCIVTPIIVRDSTLGIIMMSSAVSGKYDEDDLVFAKELAERVGFAIDSTWLVAKAKQSEMLFKRLVQSNTMGVALIGSDGQVYGVNDVILSMIGYEREEVVGTHFNWQRIYPKEYLPLLDEAQKELLETGIITTKEREFIHKNGERIPVLVGNVLIDREKRTSLSLVVDITQRKEIEKQKDNFISIASHELKTPLTSQKIFIEIMQKELKKSGKGFLKQLEKIKDQNDRLITLVNDLLDVSKMEVGRLIYRMRKNDLYWYIKDLVEVGRLTTNRKIVLRGKVKGGVYCDKDRIGQVLNNLISNAAKHSPDSTDIIVRLSETKSEVKVCVKDFGVGIAKAIQKNVFKRYYRAAKDDEVYQGFGLGLYIAHEIVAAHKGKIWFVSSKGKGSNFCFSLPKKPS